MKKRAVLNAKGEVQKVGYRDFVQNAARRLGVVGTVENMRDGSVLIVCEAEESVIEEFKNTVNVKFKFIDVEEIKVVETTEPAGEFEYFDIKRGEMAEELGERLDVSILYLGAVKDELKDEMHTGFSGLSNEMHTGFSGLSSEMKTGFSGLSSEMKTGFSGLSNEMKTGFSDLKEETKKTHEKLEKIADGTVKTHEKLDNVSGKLEKIADGTVKTHEKLDNIDNRLGDALGRYDVFGQKMISIETEMKEFTKQITRLVDHLVESKTQEK